LPGMNNKLRSAGIVDPTRSYSIGVSGLLPHSDQEPG
jgi:hypothetical protein